MLDGPVRHAPPALDERVEPRLLLRGPVQAMGGHGGPGPANLDGPVLVDERANLGLKGQVAIGERHVHIRSEEAPRGAAAES